MRKKIQKIIISRASDALKLRFVFAFFLFLFFISVFIFTSPLKIFAQDRQLEVEYPQIQGFRPETVSTSIPDYVKYIFNLFIAVVGLIGFGALIIGGARYLTSTGNAEKLKKAKKQILAAFLGILLLLFSYLILITINPQLVILRAPSLIETLPPTVPTLPVNKPIAILTPFLERINEIAQNIKVAAEGIKYYAQEIKSLTDNCDCRTTQPMCICGSSSRTSSYSLNYYGSCNILYCYSAAPNQPCPDDQKIKESQRKIIVFGNEAAYYKNRVRAEAEDLKAEIEKIINKKIKWYEQRIATEKKILEQAEEGSAKDLQQEIIRYLEEGKIISQTEKDCKESLRSKLIEVANMIEKIREPITILAISLDQCLANVKKQCSGSCKGGCHDTLGCFPVSCSGGNPCPTSQIQTQVNNINSTVPEIKKVADEIIQIVEKIKNGEVCVSTGTTTPATTTTATCQSPQELAQQNDEPYPKKRAASLETLLSCIGNETGQSLPSENGSNQFYGSLYTYEQTNELCNYTRGKEICGNCAHTVNSCHYGGATGSDGALAADFGNEKNGDRIIQAALKCGAKSGRCENSSGQTVACSDSSAHHIHINDKTCDRN